MVTLAYDIIKIIVRT